MKHLEKAQAEYESLLKKIIMIVADCGGKFVMDKPFELDEVASGIWPVVTSIEATDGAGDDDEETVAKYNQGKLWLVLKGNEASYGETLEPFEHEIGIEGETSVESIESLATILDRMEEQYYSEEHAWETPLAYIGVTDHYAESQGKVYEMARSLFRGYNIEY